MGFYEQSSHGWHPLILLLLFANSFQFPGSGSLLRRSDRGRCDGGAKAARIWLDVSPDADARKAGEAATNW